MTGCRENAHLTEPTAYRNRCPLFGIMPSLRGQTGVCYTRMMSEVDADTVRRIAHLARIAVADSEVEGLRNELNAMLAFVNQLNEVNVEGVEPMTSVTPMAMKKRADAVTDGNNAEAVLKNAPQNEDSYYLVPKVIE
jgi:aspartyl-tRNA(Asn)/glutamyl-tRNA(Gln) amidotransferase subunit C